MKTQHTPGPWRTGTKEFSTIVGDNGNKIVSTNVMNTLDATLIAAAPDLLDALDGMIKEFGFDVTHPQGLTHDEKQAIYKAICAAKKARGE